MIGMGTAVSRDVHPFSKVYGSPLRRHGANAYVLRKLGVDDQVVDRIEAALDNDLVDLVPFAQDPVIGTLISAWLSAGIEPKATVKKA
jgi:UDP-N-acetylglucosamine acyltransferase